MNWFIKLTLAKQQSQYVYNKQNGESALYGVYTLVVLCQKSVSFATLTCSISEKPQLVRKHRTGALSM